MTTHNIPLIDIAPFLSQASTETERQHVVDQVREACQVYGFFQLVGHGIPAELQAKILDCAKLFFDLPLEEKKKVGMEHAVGLSKRGYEVIGAQRLQDDALADLKEGIYIGAEIPPDSSKAGRFLQGPNLWPNLPEDQFQNPVMEYREKLLALSNQLLKILAHGLPYSPNVFDDFILDPVANVRLLHYPPQESEDPKQLGAGAHTDFGCITLLLQQPNQSGLEVLYPPTDSWIPVPAVAGRYVVNVGDLLHGWTQGAYRSAVHRVRNKGDRDRYSVPFFYSGNMDFKLRPLDGSDDGNAMSVEDHIQKKHKASYDIKLGATEIVV